MTDSPLWRHLTYFRARSQQGQVAATPLCISQTWPILCCFTSTVKWNRATTFLLISWCLTYLPDKAGRAAYAWCYKSPPGKGNFLKMHLKLTCLRNGRAHCFCCKCSLPILGFEGVLHFAPGSGPGLCLPWPFSSASNSEWLLPDMVYLLWSPWHAHDGTIFTSAYLGHIFFPQGHTGGVNLLSFTHLIWQPTLPMLLPLKQKEREECWKPWRGTWSAAGMCRAQIASIGAEWEAWQSASLPWKVLFPCLFGTH